MFRPLLTLLLLFNYLLVVGAGLAVSRPPEPLFSAAHPYVHSKDCQQNNYLRLDCFEHCNGDQRSLHRSLPTGTGLHYLAQLKGLDVHFVASLAAAAAPLRWAGLVKHSCLVLVAWSAWVGPHDYPPPQRA